MRADVEVVDAEEPANQVFVLAAPVTVSWFGFTAALQPVAMTDVFVHFTE